jgi:DNA-binding response OmpR family regulator
MIEHDGILRRIMLVEDDIDIQDIVTMALEDVGGYEVFVCGDGPTAIRMVGSIKPDLIMLDWMMPGLDGGQTLAALQDSGSIDSVPVVFMTAKAQPEELKRMVDIGGTDVVTKPFDPMDLSRRIQGIWDRLPDKQER